MKTEEQIKELLTSYENSVKRCDELCNLPDATDKGKEEIRKVRFNYTEQINLLKWVLD